MGRRDSEELLDNLEECHLDLLLPPGTCTWQSRGQETTLDLVFATEGVGQQVIECKVQQSFDFDSDHFPVSTTLDTHIGQQSTTPRRLWRETNIQTLRASLEREMPVALSAGDLQEVDDLANAIVRSINTAIDQSTPWSRPSPRSVAGFTKECKEAQMEARRLRRKAKRARTEESWEQYKRARNRKARLIDKALKTAHRERVETASESIEGLWKVAKWAKNSSPRPSYVPLLRNQDKNLRDGIKGKINVLKGTFFPEPPEADLTDLDGYQYADDIKFPPITPHEIQRAIRHAPGNKAPGPDGIPNHILHKIMDIITPALHALFNGCLATGFYPKAFKHRCTVALRKPGKGDYTRPKSYRPIALLNTIGKILDAVIARRISFAVEMHGLLPGEHMGGRKGRSTEHVPRDC